MNLKTLGKPFAMAGFLGGSIAHGFRAAASTWEGHGQSRFRNRPPKVLESQDSGLNYGIRESMVSEYRTLKQTFPIVRKINRQYANHCVGSCRLKWNTGDKLIDKAYADAWQSWMRIADLNGRHHFRKLTKIAVSSTIGDGDIFGQLDRRNGILQIAMIEADRVSSHGNYNSDADRMIGGIGLDGNGRPSFIRVWNRTAYGQFNGSQDLPRDQFVHMYDSDRADAYRGVTHYHNVLDKTRDLKETIRASTLTAKRKSRLAFFWKVVTGGKPSVDLFGDSNGNGAPEGSGNTPNIQSVGEAADVYGFPNEDVKAVEDNQPSEGWFKLMEWLVREIATGLDLPFGVVWHMSGLGGPAVRFEINQANRVFVAFLEDVLEPMWLRPIAGAWLPMEIASGRLPFHPLWYQFKTPRPASISIDLGRDSKAGVEENRAGLTTATDWYAEVDEDFEEQTDRLVYEAKYREAKRTGVPIESIKEVPLDQIRMITPNGNPATQTATTNQEDEPVAK